MNLFNILIFLLIQNVFGSLEFKRRIFKGEDAIPNEAPYLAQVRSRDKFAFRDERVCGGALISEKLVINLLIH